MRFIKRPQILKIEKTSPVKGEVFRIRISDITVLHD